MADTMSDPDEYATAIVQQYMLEHGMQSGKLLEQLRTFDRWLSVVTRQCCTIYSVCSQFLTVLVA